MGLMLDDPLRRWSSIYPSPAHRHVLAGNYGIVDLNTHDNKTRSTCRQSAHNRHEINIQLATADYK